MKKNILFLFFLISKITIACECPPLKPVSEEICKNYDVIFSGKVDSVSACSTQGKSAAYFSVSELYKGSADQYVKVDFDCSSACMMSFSKGEEWIMYTTFQRFDLLVVNLCSHSRKFFTDASQDYYQLNAQRTFEAEKQFLKITLGIHSFTQKNELSQQEEIKSRNEQPSGVNKLWLLLISFTVMAIVYFVSRKKNKNDK